MSLTPLPMFHIGGIGWTYLGLSQGATTILVSEFDALAVLGVLGVAAAVTAYVVVADPFAGPMPDGWKQRDLGTKVAASVGVPGDFVKDRFAPDETDGTFAQYSDLSS